MQTRELKYLTTALSVIYRVVVVTLGQLHAGPSIRPQIDHCTLNSIAWNKVPFGTTMRYDVYPIQIM
jgi:hypothetical protein